MTCHGLSRGSLDPPRLTLGSADLTFLTASNIELFCALMCCVVVVPELRSASQEETGDATVDIRRLRGTRRSSAPGRTETRFASPHTQSVIDHGHLVSGHFHFSGSTWVNWLSLNFLLSPVLKKDFLGQLQWFFASPKPSPGLLRLPTQGWPG